MAAGVASVAGQWRRQGERGFPPAAATRRAARGSSLLPNVTLAWSSRYCLPSEKGLEFGLQSGARELVGDPVGGLAIGVGAETMNTERRIVLDIAVEAGAAERILRRPGRIVAGED